MLVQLIDHKGKEWWVNPLYVKMVVPKGPESCEVHGVTTALGSPLRIKAPADEVAAALSAAMPDSPAWQAVAAKTSDEAQSESNAAVISGVLG